MDDLDDIVLTLTNDSGFYRGTLPYLEKYKEGRATWPEVRASVRVDALEAGVDLYGCTVDFQDQVTKAIHDHYYEEVYGCIQPTKETPMKDDEPLFKVGDKVRWRDGTNFSNGSYIAWVVSEPIGKSKREGQVWLNTGKSIELTSIEHANPCAEIDLNGNHATITKKDTIIMSKLIETKTFIRGQEAQMVDDAAIFSYIAAVEAEMASLDQINNKPKTLAKKLEDMGKEVAELVAFVDKRNNL